MLFLNKASSTKKLMFKTSIVTAMAVSLIAFSNGPAAFANSSKSAKDYDVYLDGTYIGNVTDKKIVNKIIAEKADTLEESFHDVDLNIGEQVFRSAANDQETTQNIRNIFQVQTEAAAIIIDGKPVVYVDNQTTAQEVMKKLKLQYVSEDELTE